MKSLLILFLLVLQVSAFSVNPIFSGVLQQCRQINATYYTCPDGFPISISFSISAPYAPYYGNFTVYPTNSNESTPYNVYGKICTVASSSSTTCYMNLAPFSILSGNSTVKKPVSLRLVAANYAQISSNVSFNITINHYSTSQDILIAKLYNTTKVQFSKMNLSYVYFCTIYKICSIGIQSNLSFISKSIRNGSLAINASQVNYASINLTNANNTISMMSSAFNSFTNTSNKIVNLQMQAKTVIASEAAIYAGNKTKLEKCTLGNGTTYSKFLNSSLNNLNNYKLTNTQNASAGYLNAAQNFRLNVTSLIGKCTPLSFSNPVNFNIKLPSMPSLPILPKLPLSYLVVLVVVIITVYGIHRITEEKEVKKVRETGVVKVELQDSKASSEEKKEEKPLKHESLEQSFDDWMDNLLGTKKEKKDKE